MILAALSGCAGPSHTFRIQPEASTRAGASVVDMLALTTREALAGNRPCAFSGGRGQQQTICNLVVSIPPDSRRKIGQIQWPAGDGADPDRDFVTLKAETVDERSLDTWFRKVAGKKRRLFVFVHGFNTNYDEGVYRLAQIVHDSGMDAAPVLFSWPSRGDVFSYIYDNGSAVYSRDALAYLLTRSAADPNVSDITVMAHSLGNWVMMEALRQIAIRDGSVSAKISNVILAAPDIDVDVFGSQLAAMGERLPRMTILVSRDDNALALSRTFAGGIDRVGAANPELPEYASKLEQQLNIQVVDLTKVEAGDPSHHAKFATSPEIVRLIGKRLVEGHTLGTQRIIQLHR